MGIDYTFIIPSRGDRPKALSLALEHIHAALTHSGLPEESIEALVGFDGLKGERVGNAPYVRYYDFPGEHDYGNAIRHGLLKAARGRRVIFHDDDNILLPQAIGIYEAWKDAEMLIARIDVSRAFDIPYLPVDVPGRELVRQCNIDPLCLCLSRELVVTRCGGWLGNGYEADFKNMVRYFRRAKSVKIIEDVVGVYDAGRGLDRQGLNFRQKRLEGKPACPEAG